MARYFFHLIECGNVVPDDEGREFEGVAAAHANAVYEARGLMCAELSDGRLCLGCRIDVTDIDGTCVTSVSFGDAVQITGH